MVLSYWVLEWQDPLWVDPGCSVFQLKRVLSLCPGLVGLPEVTVRVRQEGGFKVLRAWEYPCCTWRRSRLSR